MDNSLFRKNSLERISSPDQLNEYIRATHPLFWVALTGLLVLLLAAGIWSVTGSLPETVSLSGVSTADKVMIEVPLSVAKRLEAGQKAQVSPDYAPRETYGFVHGTVEFIRAEPVDGLVQIQIRLDSDNGTLRWSNKLGQAIELTSGSTCSVLIVTNERKPYELLF